jgi:hypothetical protein
VIAFEIAKLATISTAARTTIATSATGSTRRGCASNPGSTCGCGAVQLGHVQHDGTISFVAKDTSGGAAATVRFTSPLHAGRYGEHMRGVATAVAALAGLLVPTALATRPTTGPIAPKGVPAVGTARARAVPATADARPVRLELALRLDLQCGRPGPGPLLVSLPAAAAVPATIPRRAVLVDGAPPLSAFVTGHVIRLALPRPTGVTCDSIGPGTVTVVFTRAAGLGNPARPGSYRIGLTLGTRGAVARLAIT